MDNRNYILERLKSKRTTIEEFNFDSLQAPPLAMFLSPFDIQELNNIARSLKYSAKPEVRYQEIDRVMKRRGMVKFGAGTNRVVYRHPEFPDILFKVAADAIGLGDNPAEYRNQFILKPFVTKCFEISPCGTIGIFERVNPITSREEFLSVADDVFELLNEWVIGKYVVADCGAKFFMNFGVRANFGVVLLDYPYLYELDGNKLFCRKPDPLSQSGKCDGVIDYDDGYNFLRCTKCGAIYKAKELETKIKSNELIIKRKGDINMKITVSGGTNNVAKNTFTTGDEMNNSSFKVTKNSVYGKVGKSDSAEPKEAPKKKENKDTTSKEEKKQSKKTVNGAVSDSVIKSPVTFSEEYKKEALAAKEKAEKEKNPVDIVNAAIETIITNINKVDIKDLRINMINRLISYITNDNISVDMYNILAENLNKILEDTEDEDFETICKNKYIIDIVSEIFAFKLNIRDISPVDETNDIAVDYDIDVTLQFDDLNDERPVLFNDEGFQDHIIVPDGAKYIFLESANTSEETTEEGTVREVNGAEFYSAHVANIKDIFPTQKPCEVIVMTDENGDYVTDSNNRIAVIDTIDHQEVSAVTIVSKEWVDNVVTVMDMDDNAENPEYVDNNEDEAESNDEAVENNEVEENVESSNIPVGALPPETVEENMANFVDSLDEEENKEE